MRLTDADLSALYQELHPPAEDRRGCPDPETLSQAAAGDLDEAARETVVLHLEACHACAQEFRIAAGVLFESFATTPSGRPGDLRGWTRVAPALAASLAIATAALLVWNVSLRQRAAGLEAELAQAIRTAEEAERVPPAPSPAPPTPELLAHVNVPIIDLEPPSAFRSGGSRRQVIRLPENATLVTLIVNMESERQYLDYTLDLRDEGGETVWTGAGLRPGSDGTLSVAVSAALLGPGDYVFSLTGIADGPGTVLHRYPVTVASR